MAKGYPAANFKDLTGQKFGRLTVMERSGKNKFNYATWRCKCECGKEIVVPGNALRNGNTKSCGCLNLENAINRIVGFNTTHGKTNTRLFRVWSSMKTRCENPKATNYSDYGERGISVCDEWKDDFESFYNWAMSQGYDPDAKRGEYTVDRIDNEKGYSPDNCRLASYKEQANNRRSNRRLSYNGITMSMAEWARKYGRDRTLFEALTDEEAIERIEAYEAYMRENGVKCLPRRVNWKKYARRKM